MAEDKKADDADKKHVGIENLKVLENIDVELTVEVGALKSRFVTF